ncbi:MAG: hypothetical protein LBT46_07015 [Planctomycetaceae bacterium]|jgi:hypothetical protein|nr:hypothetical protein [Planctomycetaceae bacterium]
MFEVIPGILFVCYGYAVPLVIYAAMYGIRWKEGLWGNLVSAGCVWFAALIAAGWWEDVSYLLCFQLPGWMFYADSVALWLIFLLALIILDGCTRAMSGVKVYFADGLEKAGNGVAIFILATSLYGFFLFAEDMSPVGAVINFESLTAEAPQDTLFVKTLRLLSAGNLSSFTKPVQFDTYQDFRQGQLMRRQAIMFYAANPGEKMPSEPPPLRKHAIDDIIR